MLYVLPMRRLLNPLRRRSRFPSSDDVVRALHEAQAVRTNLHRDIAALLRERIVAIVLGGVVPLVMLLGFRAPMWSVMLALVCDLLIAMLADLLLTRIAAPQITRSLVSLAESEDAIKTIGILRRQSSGAFSPSGLQALALRSSPVSPLELSEPPLEAIYRLYKIGFALLLLLVFAVPNVLRFELPSGEQVRASLTTLAPFLLLSLLSRVGMAVRLAQTARRLDRHGPELLPQFPVTACCLGVSWFTTVLLWFVIEQPLLGRIGPTTILVLNIALGSLLVIYGRSRMRLAAHDADWLLRQAYGEPENRNQSTNSRR